MWKLLGMMFMFLTTISITLVYSGSLDAIFEGLNEKETNITVYADELAEEYGRSMFIRTQKMGREVAPGAKQIEKYTNLEDREKKFMGSLNPKHVQDVGSGVISGVYVAQEKLSPMFSSSPADRVLNPDAPRDLRDIIPSGNPHGKLSKAYAERYCSIITSGGIVIAKHECEENVATGMDVMADLAKDDPRNWTKVAVGAVDDASNISIDIQKPDPEKVGRYARAWWENFKSGIKLQLVLTKILG